MLVLDTDVVSALRRPERFPQVTDWLRAQHERSVFTTVLTIGEIERGIAQQAARNPAFAADLRDWAAEIETLFTDRILPFALEEARVWGEMSGRLGYTNVDLMIAATALTHGATVVTRNVSDYAATGVKVENPFLPA